MHLSVLVLRSLEAFTAICFCWDDSEPGKIWIILCRRTWGLCWVWSRLWVSLQGPANITTFSALRNLILWDRCSFLASPESRVSLWYTHVRLWHHIWKASARFGEGQQWWEAMEVACLICGKLCLDFSFISWCSELVTNADAGSCVGHICLDGAQLLGGHSQREEICPLLVQSLPFLFPGGEAAVHWEKTKAVDISDGSKVTLTRKWGHLSYRISRHLGPFWNLQKQKAEDWEPEMPSSWNMERFILYGCNMGKLLFLI